jgi:glutamine amidotransferase
MIAVIDIGTGNIGSVLNALSYLKTPYKIVRTPEDLTNEIKKIIFPGVGTYSTASQILYKTKLAEKIQTIVTEGIPILGICLGMQLLTTKGFEGGESKGLNLIEGEVRKINLNDPDLYIPHMGWNDISSISSPLLSGIPLGACFYFVHSYECIITDSGTQVSYTNHGKNIVACISKNHIHGVQFHPEKSQQVGLRVLRNFIEIC